MMGEKHDQNSDANPEFEPEAEADLESGNDSQAEAAGPEVDEAEAESGTEAASDETGRLREALLRTRAEMDNLQKRTEREVEKSRRFAVESLLRDLVPVIDSLDQGIDSAAEREGADSEGLALTRKLLVDTLERHGLEALDPAGEPFDPQWHEAMSMQPSESHDNDSVVTVLQKGYRLHDRLLRPARVIVARNES